MLVKFALELDAIDGNVSWDVLNTLMQKWEKNGILVHPTLKDLAKVMNVSKKLGHPDARKRWITMWSTVGKGDTSLRLQPLSEDSFDWEKIQSADDLAQHSGKFEVALLEETRAEVLGIGYGETKKFDEIEGVRFANHSLWPARFEINPFHIEGGSERKDIWEKHFQRLAEFSQNIVIFDRYAMTERNIKGVFWLLARLTEISKASKIQINASLTEAGYDRNNLGSKGFWDRLFRQIEERFKREFQDKRVITTKVRLFSDNNNPPFQFPHDRHIRFDNHVIGIGTGPAPTFNSEGIIRGTDVSTRILDRGEKENKEKKLEENSALMREFILPYEV